MAALRATGLHKNFGDHELLDGLDLEIEPGETVVLRGPNGAGKSTLLGCLAGVVVPDRGRVLIDGHDLLADPLPARRALRYLPQEVEVPPGVSGQELLRLWADVFGAPSIDTAAAATGLGDALPRLATTYSVGMRRLLAFGSVMLGDAKLLVLDEPFAGVDDEGRARMRKALVARRDTGSAIVLATHGHDVEALDELSPRQLRLGGPLTVDDDAGADDSRP